MQALGSECLQSSFLSEISYNIDIFFMNFKFTKFFLWFFGLQAVCPSFQTILVMVIAVIKQIMKDAHMMVVIVVDQMSIHSIALNVYAINKH